MAITREQIGQLVADGVAAIEDDHVREKITPQLIEPELVRCSWDYGEPGEAFDCWFIAIAPHWDDVRIAYCDEGFGPQSPWGLVFCKTASQPVPSIGSDSGWFTSLEDVFRDCLNEPAG